MIQLNINNQFSSTQPSSDPIPGLNNVPDDEMKIIESSNLICRRIHLDYTLNVIMWDACLGTDWRLFVVILYCPPLTLAVKN